MTLLLVAANMGCATAPPVQSASMVVTHHESKTERDEVALFIEVPPLPEHASCREARAAYVESWDIEAGAIRPDLSRGLYGSVLGRGHYFESCNVPDDTEISICAAVQNGQVLGASVATTPRAPRLERCIDQGVRALNFPDHPRMDVTQTVFRASL
jgi:hypothetical protein